MILMRASTERSSKPQVGLPQTFPLGRFWLAKKKERDGVCRRFFAIHANASTPSSTPTAVVPAGVTRPSTRCIHVDRVSSASRDRSRSARRRTRSSRASFVNCPCRYIPFGDHAYNIVQKVEQLEISLNDPAIREEAADVLRSLIDRIELQSGSDGKSVDAMLHGDLAEILTICGEFDRRQKLPETRTSGSQLSGGCGDLQPPRIDPTSDSDLRRSGLQSRCAVIRPAGSNPHPLRQQMAETKGFRGKWPPVLYTTGPAPCSHASRLTTAEIHLQADVTLEPTRSQAPKG